MELSIKSSNDNTTVLNANGGHIELVNSIISHMFDNPKFAALILDADDYYRKTFEIRNYNSDTQD